MAVDNRTQAQAPITTPSPDRYVAEGPAEPDGPSGRSAVDLPAAALAATTIGELYDAASAAQASGAWNERDGDWCRALREALVLDVPIAALALCRRELGATVIERRRASS